MAQKTIDFENDILGPIGSLKSDLVNVNETVTDKLYPKQDIDFYYEKDDVTVSANRRCFFPNVLIPGTYLERIDLWVAPMRQEQILDIQFEIWKYDNGKIYIMDSRKYSLDGGNTNYEKKSFEIGKSLTRNTIISIYTNLAKIASNKNDLKKSRYTTDISTGLFTFSDISETSYTPCVKIYAHTINACLETKIEDLVFSSSNVLIVNPQNSKAYQSIKKAIDNAKDNDTIIIYPGTYKEQITNVNKHLSLIGVDKEKCIIYDDSGNYSTPPLESAYGYYKNLTIIERKIDGVTNDTQFRPYAVHIDIPVLQSDTYVPQNEYENLLFEDCVFISDWAYAVGVGMIKNYTLKFKGCMFISNYDTSTYPTGAFLVHSSANTQTLLGDNQNLICEECNFISTKTNNIISVHEYNPNQNKMYLTFIRCTLWSDTNGKNTPFHINWSTTDSGWMGAKSIFLKGISYGNNVNSINN